MEPKPGGPFAIFGVPKIMGPRGPLGILLAPSWGHLGGMLGPSWGYLWPSWGYLGPSWANLGPSWGHLGPSWGHLGPSWSHLGSFWGSSWALWTIWSHLGAILGPSVFLMYSDVLFMHSSVLLCPLIPSYPGQASPNTLTKISSVRQQF